MHDVPASGAVVGALDGDDLLVLFVLAPAAELAGFGGVEHQVGLGHPLRRHPLGARFILGDRFFLADRFLDRLERRLFDDLLDDLLDHLFDDFVGDRLGHGFGHVLEQLLVGQLLEHGLVRRRVVVVDGVDALGADGSLLRRPLGFGLLGGQGLGHVLLVAADEGLFGLGVCHVAHLGPTS